MTARLGPRTTGRCIACTSSEGRSGLAHFLAASYSSATFSQFTTFHHAAM